jgi:hypothetical protein
MENNNFNLNSAKNYVISTINHNEYINVSKWIGHIYLFFMKLWILFMIIYEWCKSTYDSGSRHIIGNYFDEVIHNVDFVNLTENKVYPIYNLFNRLSPTNIYLIIMNEFKGSHPFSNGIPSDVLTYLQTIIKQSHVYSHDGYIRIRYYSKDSSHDILINLDKFYEAISQTIIKIGYDNNAEDVMITSNIVIDKHLHSSKEDITNMLWIFEIAIMRVIDYFINNQVVEPMNDDILHATINNEEITNKFKRYRNSFRNDNIKFNDLRSILNIIHGITTEEENTLKLTWTHGTTLDEMDYNLDDHINFEVSEPVEEKLSNTPFFRKPITKCDIKFKKNT